MTPSYPSRSYRCALVTLLALAVVVATSVWSPACAQEWQDLHSVADVCRDYPDEVMHLFAALDLDRPELANVKAAIDEGDYPTASERLLEYYRTANTASWLRTPQPPTPGDHAEAVAILNDIYSPLGGDAATLPRLKSGGLDWHDRGPEGDVEWAFSLNRHSHLRTLLEAYRATGDKRFVRRIDLELRDWIAASLPYPAKKTRDPMWRGLETNFRVNVWSQIFYVLQDDPELRPATRLLMLASLPSHGDYLRRFHRGGGNWLAMESAALGELAVNWPEFKAASDWFAYAQQKQEEETRRQVYPDGVQHELSASYHGVTLRNFARFAEVSRHASFPISAEFRQRLERMHDYQARSMRPDGTNPHNNDSDLDDVRPALIRAADVFERPDWLYIATMRQQGTAPEGPASTMYPWGGQLISRSGWGADAQWSFFDIGPWGTGHQHNDKLHLSLAAHGRDLLVDSGRFAYDGELADRFKSRYARHSRGHNVILIDGRGQGPGPERAREPLAESEYRVAEVFDFARGSCDHYDGLEGEANHTRALFYLRGRYWVVVDRITTDRPRDIEVLWHFHPDCTPMRDGESVATTDPGVGNLRVMPFGSELQWKLELVEGQEEPYPQGWYSPSYGEYAPSTCAVYSAEIDGTATFAWLLTTAQGEAPRMSASLQEASGPCPVAYVADGVERERRLPLRLEKAVPELKQP